MISKKLFSIMFNIIKLNEKDNIGIAPMEIPENTKINLNIVTKNQIPFGHKISLQDINKGSFIYRYGQIIGTASNDILSGQHVHSHNLIFSEFDRKYEIKSKLIDNKDQTLILILIGINFSNVLASSFLTIYLVDNHIISEYLIIPLIESEGTDIAVLSCCVPKTL